MPTSYSWSLINNTTAASTGDETEITTNRRNLMLDDEGDLVFSGGKLQMVEGGDAVTQAVKSALKFVRGEWFLDETEGVPYRENVLVKNPDPNVLHVVFRDAILAVPGVTALEELEFDLDRETRTLTVTFRASDEDGNEITGEV